MAYWTFSDAKERFEDIVEAALKEPQHIRRADGTGVVVMSFEEFERLDPEAAAKLKSQME